MLIALSGFACNGKSSMLDRIVDSFCVVKGYRAMKLEEAARDVDRFPFLSNSKENFQRSILSYEIGRLRLVESLKLVGSVCEGVLFFADRSLIDNLAFCVMRGFMTEAGAAEVFLSVVEEATYSLICLIEGIEDEEYIRNNCLSDDLRKDTIGEHFLGMQKQFYSAWDGILEKIEKEGVKLKVKRYRHPHLDFTTSINLLIDIENVVFTEKNRCEMCYRIK